MTWGLWIGGLALLATACAATWFLWPQIVRALVAWAGEAIWAALKDDRMTPEEEAEWRDRKKTVEDWDQKGGR